MSNNNTSWGSGQPVGLPPVAGASKEGDEQRGVAKIKPIPLLLSTRAPILQTAGMIQANAAPSAVARGAGRPSTSQQPYHPGATATGSGGGAAPALGFGDAGAGPGSPGGGAAYRNTKFTRIKGFQPAGGSGGGLALEGSGVQLLGQQGQQQLGQQGQHGQHGQQGLAGDAQQWGSRRGLGASGPVRSLSRGGQEAAFSDHNSGPSVRASSAAGAASTVGPGAARPDTAGPLDPLSATYPAAGAGGRGGAGLVPPAPINPPLPGPPAMAWAAPQQQQQQQGGGGGGMFPEPTVNPHAHPLAPSSDAGGSLGMGGGMDTTSSLGAYPPDPDMVMGGGGGGAFGFASGNAAAAAAAGGSGTPNMGGFPGHMLSQQQAQPHQQQQQMQMQMQMMQMQQGGAGAGAGASQAQLLQRLYRTNLTPQPQSAAPGQLPPHPDFPPAPPGAAAAASPYNAESPSPPPTAGRHMPGAPSISGMASLVLGASRPTTTTNVNGANGANGANGYGMSPPMTAGSGGSRPRTRGASAGTLADLSAALQKSIAAGMGEWDLTADGLWGHPEVQERLLRGPLGPEVLKHRYRMEERDIIALYRLLYSYSVGFFTDVQSLVEGSVMTAPRGVAGGGGAAAALSGLRQELLENVFRAYASLWDEALMIVFDSEMAAVLAEKTAALQALDAGVVELEALRQENEQLQARLADFVTQNIDNMLATRHMKHATNAMEGQLHSLSAANDQLVTHMAGHAVQVTTLERQLDAARAATRAAEARAAAAESHVVTLKGVVGDQNATLSGQFFQIKELEKANAELQESLRQMHRRRAAALASLGGGAGGGATPEPSDGGAAAGLLTDGDDADGGSAGGGRGRGGAVPDVAMLNADELERLLADKSRAFALLHADFVVKMHELDDQRSITAGLREDIRRLQSDVAAAEGRATDSARVADRYKSRWEGGRMAMEDLEGQNRRLTSKNADLVRSYWPLMTRLKEAEADAAAARQQAAEDRAAVEAAAAEAAALRQANEAMEALAAENRAMREEQESHELEVPADLLAMLSAGQAASLRRFARCCHRRVAHLNQQVVGLVDQLTAARFQIMNLTNGNGSPSGAAAPPLRPNPFTSATTTATATATATPPASLAGPPTPSGGSFVGGFGGLGSAPGSPTRLGLGGGGSAASTAAGGFLGFASLPPEEELQRLRAALAGRDRWINVLCRGMTQVVGIMESLMSKDGDSCAALRLEQQRRRRAAIRAARRAAAAAAGQPYESAPPSPVRRGGGGAAGAGADAIPDASADADSEETAVVAGEASSASAAAGGGAAAGGPGELSLAPSGGLAGGASGFGDAGVEEEHEEEQEEEEEGLDEDPAFVVASGRLAQLMGLTTAHGGLGGHSLGAGGDVVAGIELAPQIVSLDRNFERLADSAERLVEWADSLMRRKEQTATFPQLKQRLDVALRQLDAANAELVALRPAAESLRFSVRAYETKYKDMAARVASATQRAGSAESRLTSAEQQLGLVRQQLADTQEAHKRLEEQYWKAKEVALEAEVTTGELKAGRVRALEAAAKALSSVAGLEREAKENRDLRVALESDLVGYKAWVRHMEAVERAHREVLRELAQAAAGCEERDRQLAELRDRTLTLEQQLRSKSAEATSADTRVKALTRELAEERKAASAAAAAARATAAAQLDAAIRQAGGAEEAAAAASERAAELEGRLTEANRQAAAAMAAAASAAAALEPLRAERDRLKAHVAASAPLLSAMDRAAGALGRRLTLLEDTVATTAAQQQGSLEAAVEGLLGCVESALDAFGGTARAAAGDATPALLGALEGLVTQLLATLSKGGKEPMQSLTVLKAQLARDDKELAGLREALAAASAAGEDAARSAEEQRRAAAKAAAAASAASAAAQRDGRRAVEAETALRRARAEAEAYGRSHAAAKAAAEEAKKESERLQRRLEVTESDLIAARRQQSLTDSAAAASAAQRAELQRRVEEVEAAAARDRDAAREARGRAEAAEQAASAAAARAAELEAQVAAASRDVERLSAERASALTSLGEARDKALGLEQSMLEMQAKHADILRHDESVEEKLRHALFEAEACRKRAAEAQREAAEAAVRAEALQQQCWQLSVAMQAKAGEKEEALRALVEATHAVEAKKQQQT